MRKWFDLTRFRLIYGFRGLLRSHKRNLTFIGATKLILLLTGIASPYLFMILIDEVMINQDTSVLLWICLGYAALFLIESLTQYLQLYFMNKYRLKFGFDLRTKLWKRIMKFSLDMQKQYPSGDLKNRLDEDVERCEAFVEQQIINYGFFWVISIINGAILLNINWKLALFGFLMVPISFWMVRWLGNGVKRSSETYRKDWGGYEGWLFKVLGNWMEIKALGIERRQKIAFTRHWKKLSESFFKRQMYLFGNRTFIAFKDFFITRMNLYFLGGLLIFNGELTVGSLIVFMKYYEYFFSGINSINNLDLEIKNDYPAIQRVSELLSMPESVNADFVPDNFEGAIRFENVTYLHDESTGEGVKDINLTIAPGEKVAIVGKSGSGKSTLVNLLTGLYAAQKGTVFFDDVPLQSYDSRFIRKQIGVVMQENFIFNLSIEENLRLANAKASMGEIVEVCKSALIHQPISEMPEGYNTVLGEKGVRLSGGQKQRLMIARALLKNPKIMILDEATSQLDHRNEQQIQQSFRQLFHRKTVIMVTHNPSSITHADRIIVLKDGRIVGDGPLAHLQENNEHFKQLMLVNA